MRCTLLDGERYSGVGACACVCVRMWKEEKKKNADKKQKKEKKKKTKEDTCKRKTFKMEGTRERKKAQERGM